MDYHVITFHHVSTSKSLLTQAGMCPVYHIKKKTNRCNGIGVEDSNFLCNTLHVTSSAYCGTEKN